MCFNLSLKIIWHISWDNYLSNDIDEDANGDRDIGPGGQNQAPTQIRAADTEQRAAAQQYDVFLNKPAPHMKD